MTVFNKLSAPVLELLASRIDSFEKLEILLALQAAPRSTMSVDELSRTVKLSRETVREVVTAFRGSSLADITVTGEVQLLPPTSKDHAAVAELARVYADDRLAVVQAMGEVSLRRLRGMASRAFADAFVIRKRPEKEEDGDG